jgi:hypothetical protein
MYCVLILILGVCMLLRVWDQGEGGFLVNVFLLEGGRTTETCRTYDSNVA